VSIISMATNRLNRSPVRKAADTPAASTRYTEVKPDVVALGTGLADGVHEHGQQHRGGHHEQERGESVGHQRDAQGCRPSTALGGPRAVAVHVDQERHGQAHVHGEHRQPRGALHPP
jgi:hypothetical protein